MTQIRQCYPHPLLNPLYVETPAEKELLIQLIASVGSLPPFADGRSLYFGWWQGDRPRLYLPSPFSPKLAHRCYSLIIRYEDRFRQNQDFQEPYVDSRDESLPSFSFILIPLCYQHHYLGGIGIARLPSAAQPSAAELGLVKGEIQPLLATLFQHRQAQQLAELHSQQQWLQSLYQLLTADIAPLLLLSSGLDRIRHYYQAETVQLFLREISPENLPQQWSSPADLPSNADRKRWLQQCLDETGEIRQTLFCCDFPNSMPSQLAIVLPVWIAGQPAGLLVVSSLDCVRQFSAPDLNTLDAIATYFGCIIHKYQTQQALWQLTRENERLQDNCQNKSDFLSHINHELRTPLTGILGFAKMLREEIYGALNDKQRQYVQGIAVSGEHLLALVNDFLDLSKIEANREELYWERVAVEDMCLAALAIVQTRAKEQGLELLLDIAPGIDFCTVDQRRIKQILLNLLSNAIKFTETGSVRLEVRSKEDRLQFCVIDTGIGIQDSDRSVLFQPFQQINNALSRKHKGTGLGLALSRKLAQLHGGDLTFTSTFRQGSCFTLNLPCRPLTDHNQDIDPL